MQLLRQAVIKPRIKPWVDTFPNHNIEEELFNDYEANDPFVQTLVMNLAGLLGSFVRGGWLSAPHPILIETLNILGS